MSTSSQLGGVVLLTVAEVAALMHLSTRAVYRLIHAGDLPALRIGHSFRIPETAIPARRVLGSGDLTRT